MVVHDEFGQTSIRASNRAAFELQAGDKMVPVPQEVQPGTIAIESTDHGGWFGAELKNTQCDLIEVNGFPTRSEIQFYMAMGNRPPLACYSSAAIQLLFARIT